VQEDKRNMCRTELVGAGGGGGLFNISRAGGGNPEDSGSVSQTKRLHKSNGTLVLGGLSEFTLL